MAQFPTAEDLGTRLPQDQGGTVRPAEINFSGQRQLGSTLKDYALDMKVRRDRLQRQKAQTHWAKKKLEADKAFDQDQDYETYIDRYQEMLNKGREEALGMVSDPDLKAMLQEDISLSEAQGLEQMKDYAFQKEKDSGLADLQTILDDNREIALNATTSSDRQAAFDTMNDAIETAKLNGYLSAEQAEGRRKQVAISAAVGTINVQDLKTQRDMLSNNKGPAELLPTDQRKTMLESVNKRLVNQEGMIKADEIRSQGGSLPDRLNRVREIKDPDVRSAAQRQVEHDYSLEKTARLESESENYNEARKALNSGQSIGEWIQQNPQGWDGMSGDQQKSLITGTTKKTDRQAYVTFMEMASKDVNKAKDYLYSNAHKFDDTDFEKFVGMVTKPQKLDSFLTRSETMNIKLQEAGITKNSEKHFKALQALEKDYLKFQEGNNREPSAKELESMTNDVFDKVIDTVWFNPFTEDKYGFDLTQQQREDRRTQEKDDRFEKYLNDYKIYLEGDSGVPTYLSDEEVNRLYQVWDAQGYLDADN